MIPESDLKEPNLKVVSGTPTAAHVSIGVPVPKVIRVKQFSPSEWEEFTEEYASALKGHYAKVRLFAGAGDMGIDVACFLTDGLFSGGWDNHQCKRFKGALQPNRAWVEIAKIIYYSFKGEYPPPRKHYFCASEGLSTKLEKLLANPEKLKIECRKAWPEKCEAEITSTQVIKLDGDLLAYFELFDFSIFSSKSVLEMITIHQGSPNHAVRFGGGLPPRGAVSVPPVTPASHESRYIAQLLEAYGDHEKQSFPDVISLGTHPNYEGNLRRQRERFYSAEALRNFSRDTVPEGTFANLQQEVYHGVVDECDGTHESGFVRMSQVMKCAGAVASISNPLAPATTVQDRQGICHQLANDDVLIWVKNGN